MLTITVCGAWLSLPRYRRHPAPELELEQVLVLVLVLVLALERALVPPRVQPLPVLRLLQAL